MVGSKNFRIGVLSLFALTVFSSNAVSGEAGRVPDSTDTFATKPCRCFRGQPAARCRLYWITEVGFLSVLDSKAGPCDWEDKLRLSLDLGYMFNVSGKDAIGASVFLHTFEDADFSYWGIKPRYRRWLAHDVGLDLGLGIGRWEYGVKKTAWPLVFQLGLSFRDYFSLTLMYDRTVWSESIPIPGTFEYADGPSHTSSTWSFGITAGSYPALAAMTVVCLIAIYSSLQPSTTDVWEPRFSSRRFIYCALYTK